MENSNVKSVITRRSLLGTIAAAGVGAAFFGLTSAAHASALEEVLELSTVSAPLYDGEAVTDAPTWSKAIYPTVHLSKTTTVIAKSKAVNPKVREFAVFEYNETNAVSQIENESGVPVPPKTPKAIHLLSKLNSATGNDFDVAFITAQRDAHKFLRDLTANYLSNAPQTSDPAETAGRHLALISLQFFKEHLKLSEDILTTLSS